MSREITAEQYRTRCGGDLNNDFDEVFLVVDGQRTEVWDVDRELDSFGNVWLTTARGEIRVTPNTPLAVS